MSKQDIINQYLKIFHLDERATQKELELTYETLTKDKNISNDELQGYRNSFEYLMHTMFNTDITPTLNTQQGNISEDEVDDVIKRVISIIPRPVKDAIDFIERKLGVGKLTDSAQIIWSTQNVNMLLLVHKMYTYCHNIFGFKFWTSKQIHKIISESCLNPIEYISVSFELSSELELKEQIKDIRSFVKNFHKMYYTDKINCPIFKISNTKCGISGYIMAHKDLCRQLVSLLHTKALQSEYMLNLVTNDTNDVSKDYDDISDILDDEKDDNDEL